ncbi:MAG: DUF4430 domain-containing protein [Oscillospiraceae bacterium]|nr:DUF4430 domain-containing protein [Oscillospiraceae bacterium]
MKRNSMKNKLSVVLCVVLIAAMALIAAGCTDTGIPGGSSDPTYSHAAATFTFVVVDAEGNETTREITSDADTVGAALMAEGLIDGEEGEYGLYVKTVDGITLDYETDGKYWAFYENGEYGLTGVDQTAITDGATYTFKAE